MAHAAVLSGDDLRLLCVLLSEHAFPISVDRVHLTVGGQKSGLRLKIDFQVSAVIEDFVFVQFRVHFSFVCIVKTGEHLGYK